MAIKINANVADLIERIVFLKGCSEIPYATAKTVTVSNGDDKNRIAALFAECVSYSIEFDEIEFVLKMSEEEIEAEKSKNFELMQSHLNRLKKLYREEDGESIEAYLALKGYDWLKEMLEENQRGEDDEDYCDFSLEEIKRSGSKEGTSVACGHFYGQHAWHGTVSIVLNEKAIDDMISALTEAKRDGYTRVDEIYAGDGEGYDVEIYKAEEKEIERLSVPYSDKIAAEKDADRLRNTVGFFRMRRQKIDSDQGSDDG